MTNQKKIYINDLIEAHQVLAEETLGYIIGGVNGHLVLSLDEDTGEIYYYQMFNNSHTNADITSINLNCCLSDIIEQLEYDDNGNIIEIAGQPYSEKELFEDAAEWLPEIEEELNNLETIYEKMQTFKKEGKNVHYWEGSICCKDCEESLEDEDNECDCNTQKNEVTPSLKAVYKDDDVRCEKCDVEIWAGVDCDCGIDGEDHEGIEEAYNEKNETVIECNSTTQKEEEA